MTRPIQRDQFRDKTLRNLIALLLRTGYTILLRFGTGVKVLWIHRTN